MKATELMIGDWVEFPHGKDTVQEITYVCGKGYCVSFAASATLFKFPIADVEPIPLTEEILEKNGFVRHDKHEYSVTGSNYKYLKVRCYADTNFEIGNAFDEEGELQAFADIQYVHELQHALKLCGIKEIEIIL